MRLVDYSTLKGYKKLKRTKVKTKVKGERMKRTMKERLKRTKRTKRMNAQEKKNIKGK